MAGRLDVAELVADGDRLAGRNAAAREQGAHPARLAEQGGAAGEVVDQRGVRRTECAADIRLRVRADDPDPKARFRKAPQHPVHAREEGDAPGIAGLQPAHVGRDAWQPPQRHAEAPQDLPVSHGPQRLELGGVGHAKTVPAGDLREDAPEPGQRIGEGAVEVEEDEPQRHRRRGRGEWGRPLRGSRPAVRCRQVCRSTSIFLISPIAAAGLSPFGQVRVQFMIVWQR